MTWTENAVREALGNIEETKRSLERCRHCKSCGQEEICDVAIANATGLLHDYERTQAFHLVSDGINRLWGKEEIKVKSIKKRKVWHFRRNRKKQESLQPSRIIYKP